MDLDIALRKIRVEKSLRQNMVAKKAKISQTYLSQIESGGKFPSDKVVKKLCKVYGVPYIVLAWYGTNEADIKPDKKHFYLQLKPLIDGLISQIVK